MALYISTVLLPWIFGIELGALHNLQLLGALDRCAVSKGEWKHFHNILIAFLSILLSGSHVDDWFSHTEIAAVSVQA